MGLQFSYIWNIYSHILFEIENNISTVLQTRLSGVLKKTYLLKAQIKWITFSNAFSSPKQNKQKKNITGISNGAWSALSTRFLTFLFPSLSMLATDHMEATMHNDTSSHLVIKDHLSTLKHTDVIILTLFLLLLSSSTNPLRPKATMNISYKCCHILI